MVLKITNIQYESYSNDFHIILKFENLSDDENKLSDYTLTSYTSDIYLYGRLIGYGGTHILNKRFSDIFKNGLVMSSSPIYDAIKQADKDRERNKDIYFTIGINILYRDNDGLSTGRTYLIYHTCSKEEWNNILDEIFNRTKISTKLKNYFLTLHDNLKEYHITYYAIILTILFILYVLLDNKDNIKNIIERFIKLVFP